MISWRLNSPSPEGQNVQPCESYMNVYVYELIYFALRVEYTRTTFLCCISLAESNRSTESSRFRASDVPSVVYEWKFLFPSEDIIRLF
jgi:hypothetical protein